MESTRTSMRTPARGENATAGTGRDLWDDSREGFAPHFLYYQTGLGSRTGSASMAVREATSSAASS